MSQDKKTFKISGFKTTSEIAGMSGTEKWKYRKCLGMKLYFIWIGKYPFE